MAHTLFSVLSPQQRMCLEILYKYVNKDNLNTLRQKIKVLSSSHKYFYSKLRKKLFQIQFRSERLQGFMFKVTNGVVVELQSPFGRGEQHRHDELYPPEHLEKSRFYHLANDRVAAYPTNGFK